MSKVPRRNWYTESWLGQVGKGKIVVDGLVDLGSLVRHLLFGWAPKCGKPAKCRLETCHLTDEDTFGIGRDTSFDEGEIYERAPAYPTYAPHFDPRLPSPPTHENQRGYVIPDVMRHAFLDSYNDPNMPSTSSGPIYPIAGDHMFANAPRGWIEARCLDQMDGNRTISNAVRHWC